MILFSINNQCSNQDITVLCNCQRNLDSNKRQVCSYTSVSCFSSVIIYLYAFGSISVQGVAINVPTTGSAVFLIHALIEILVIILPTRTMLSLLVLQSSCFLLNWFSQRLVNSANETHSRDELKRMLYPASLCVCVKLEGLSSLPRLLHSRLLYSSADSNNHTDGFTEIRHNITSD